MYTTKECIFLMDRRVTFFSFVEIMIEFNQEEYEYFSFDTNS